MSLDQESAISSIGRSPCTPCQRASYTSKTDSFLWGHGPDTLACKARPSFDGCGTSLSVSLSLSLSIGRSHLHVLALSQSLLLRVSSSDVHTSSHSTKTLFTSRRTADDPHQFTECRVAVCRRILNPVSLCTVHCVVRGSDGCTVEW